jgi:hypothetical protein
MFKLSHQRGYSRSPITSSLRVRASDAAMSPFDLMNDAMVGEYLKYGTSAALCFASRKLPSELVTMSNPPLAFKGDLTWDAATVGFFWTVSIVAAFAIGRSVAPALLEGNALIRLCKKKVWQGRALPSRYCCEKVPWREHRRLTRSTRWPSPSNLNHNLVRVSRVLSIRVTAAFILQIQSSISHVGVLSRTVSRCERLVTTASFCSVFNSTREYTD